MHIKNDILSFWMDLCSESSDHKLLKEVPISMTFIKDINQQKNRSGRRIQNQYAQEV